MSTVGHNGRKTGLREINMSYGLVAPFKREPKLESDRFKVRL
jgi:hypothetical protein